MKRTALSDEPQRSHLTTLKASIPLRPHRLRRGSRPGFQRQVLRSGRNAPSRRIVQNLGSELRPSSLQLALIQAEVDTAPGQQLCMRSLLNQPSTIQDQYLIGPEDGRKPVRDHE